MKKYFINIVFFTLTGFSQNYSGIAYYNSMVVLDKDSDLSMGILNPEEEQKLRDDLKKSYEKTYKLQFNNFESNFSEEIVLEKNYIKKSKVKIKHAEKQGILYKNILKNIIIDEMEFFDKEFLISDTLPKLNWEITNETKKIGNYICTKATILIKAKQDVNTNQKTNLLDNIKKKDKLITAWFTIELPISNGPERFWGLPGLILEVVDDKTIYICSKIVINPKEIIEIKIPNRGKKVTKKEYDEITEERLKD